MKKSLYIGNKRYKVIFRDSAYSLNTAVATYAINYRKKPAGVDSFIIYVNNEAKSTNPSGGSIQVSHGDKVYAIAEAKNCVVSIYNISSNSNAPTIVTDNIDIDLVVTRKTYTATFTKPEFGSWEHSSLTLSEGTTWKVNKDKITFTDPDGKTVTNTATTTISPTAYTLSFAADENGYGTWSSTDNVSVYDYSYSTPTIQCPAGDSITANSTFTANITRTPVAFTNAYEGTQTWKISGTDTAGQVFTREFTVTHNEEFYYEITGRSHTVTQAVGNITFTPTVARTTHTYPITIKGSEYGTVYKQDGITLVTNKEKVPYGTILILQPAGQLDHPGHTIGVTATGELTDIGSKLLPKYELVVDGKNGNVFIGKEEIEFTKTPNTYTVEYENNNSAIEGNLPTPNPQEFEYPTVVTIATNNMTRDDTVASSYIVTYDYNGGSKDRENDTAITYRHYTANGWTSTEDNIHYNSGASFTWSNTGSLKLCPYFTSTTSGGSVILPHSTRTGYTFVTWNDGGMEGAGAGGDSYEPRSNITLTASWKVNEYKLSITKGIGVDTVTVTRTSSPLKGASTNVTLSDGATIYYGDTLTVSAIDTTGYTVDSYTQSYTVTDNVSVNITATINTCIVSYDAMPTGVESFIIYYKNGTAIITDPIASGSFLVDYNSQVYAVATAATGYNEFIVIKGVGRTADTATTITADTKIEVKPPALKTFTVEVVPNNSSYGSVSPTSVTNVPYNTSISSSGSTLTIGSATVTATPKTNTDQYEYQHTGWSNASGTVTANRRVIANFCELTRTYLVSYNAKPDGVDTFVIYKNNAEVVKDPKEPDSFTVSYGDYVYANATLLSGYEKPKISGVSDDSGNPTQITGNVTVSVTAGDPVTALAAPTIGTISWDNDAQDEWMLVPVKNSNKTSVTAHMTVKDHTGAVLETDTFTLAAGSNKEWASDYCDRSKYFVIECYFTAGSVTSPIASKTEGTLPTYTIGFRYNNSSYGRLSHSSVTNVPYGTTISASGNTLKIGSTTVTATPTLDNDQFDYSFIDWLDIPSDGKVAGDIIITANFDRVIKTYTVEFNVSPVDYGTITSTKVENVPYGTSITQNGNTVTVGTTTVTVSPTDASYYFTDWKADPVPEDDKVRSNIEVTANFIQITPPALNFIAQSPVLLKLQITNPNPVDVQAFYAITDGADKNDLIKKGIINIQSGKAAEVNIDRTQIKNLLFEATSYFTVGTATSASTAASYGEQLSLSAPEFSGTGSAAAGGSSTYPYANILNIRVQNHNDVDVEPVVTWTTAGGVDVVDASPKLIKANDYNDLVCNTNATSVTCRVHFKAKYWNNSEAVEKTITAPKLSKPVLEARPSEADKRTVRVTNNNSNTVRAYVTWEAPDGTIKSTANKSISVGGFADFAYTTELPDVTFKVYFTANGWTNSETSSMTITSLKPPELIEETAKYLWTPMNNNYWCAIVNVKNPNAERVTAVFTYSSDWGSSTTAKVGLEPGEEKVYISDATPLDDKLMAFNEDLGNTLMISCYFTNSTGTSEAVALSESITREVTDAITMDGIIEL